MTAERYLAEELVVVAEPTPTGAIPPGHVGYEENGKIVWSGPICEVGNAPERVGWVSWLRVPGNRYLMGVPQ